MTTTGLVVEGTLPAGLSGRLVGIGPDHSEPLRGDHGVVHSIHVHAARAISYRHSLVTPGVGVSSIVAFGGSILTFGQCSLAYELAADLDTLRQVDLAGQSRGVVGYPKRDPATGDLHLLATTAAGVQAHVVVSSGALTRTSRPIADAPTPITDLAITRDCVVFVADGFVGVAPRHGDACITWVGTGIQAPSLVHAHDAGDAVVVHCLTPALERWTVDVGSVTVHRNVLDPTPRRFARTIDYPGDMAPRFLWTTGEGTLDKHDLVSTSCSLHTFSPDCTPGDLVLVVDPERQLAADGAWLVGFVHHATGETTDLVVLDAADMARTAIATVRIPHRIPRGVHTTWIPSAHE